MITVFGSAAGAEEAAEAAEAITGNWMGAGPKVRRFEQDMAERLGVPDLVMTNSGSAALHMAVTLLDLPPGSEVVLPALTWVACAQAVLLAGCVPVFCDVDLDSHNVTADLVAARMTSRTRAVMVVHYAGKPVDMAPVLALGLPVIEDAAHAVDSRHGGRACGTIGTIGIFSFDPVKNLATPDAGAVAARDPALVRRARELRHCGVDKTGFQAREAKSRWWEHQVTAIYPHYGPNDVAAGVGLAQLRKLDRLQERRRAIWETYQERLADLAWITRPLEAADDERHSYFCYTIRVAGGRRDELAHYLLERGIYTTLRYQPLHLLPIFGGAASLPNCEALDGQALSLPLHPRLSGRDLARVIDAVQSFGGT